MHPLPPAGLQYDNHGVLTLDLRLGLLESTRDGESSNVFYSILRGQDRNGQLVSGVSGDWADARSMTSGFRVDEAPKNFNTVGEARCCMFQKPFHGPDGSTFHAHIMGLEVQQPPKKQVRGTYRELGRSLERRRQSL